MGIFDASATDTPASHRFTFPMQPLRCKGAPKCPGVLDQRSKKEDVKKKALRTVGDWGAPKCVPLIKNVKKVWIVLFHSHASQMQLHTFHYPIPLLLYSHSEFDNLVLHSPHHFISKMYNLCASHPVCKVAIHLRCKGKRQWIRKELHVEVQRCIAKM